MEDAGPGGFGGVGMGFGGIGKRLNLDEDYEADEVVLGNSKEG